MVKMTMCGQNDLYVNMDKHICWIGLSIRFAYLLDLPISPICSPRKPAKPREIVRHSIATDWE